MKRFPRIPVFLCTLHLVSHPGCSIREDRDLCPCQLVLDLPQGAGETTLWMEMRPTAPFDYSVGSGGTVAGAAVTRTETLPVGTERYHMAVRRGTVSLLAWTTGPSDRPDIFPISSGPELSPYEPLSFWGNTDQRAARAYQVGEEGIRIPEGEECPELRLFRRTYDTLCEQIRDTVRFRKEYCMLDLRILSQDVLLELAVRGGYCGFGPGDRLLEGTFFFRMRPDGAGRARVRVPRQGDDSLVLEIRDDPAADSAAAKFFALGEYLRESGYDWTAADLADVEILIDYARTSVTLRIDRWTTVIPFDIEI